MAAVARTYAMTRLAAGSYLLPSNDGKTLWHIYSFMDGESFGLTGERDQKYWACSYFPGDVEWALDLVAADMEDYGHVRHDEGYPSYRSLWRETDTYLRTRAAAIDAALRHERGE